MTQNILPPGWLKALPEGTQQRIEDNLQGIRDSGKHIAPSEENILRAYHLTDFEDVKVLLQGQDPYHTPGVANGLAFAVNADQSLPPSLANIYREVYHDLDDKLKDRTLITWAKQGVLLLNSSLTVEIHKPASHVGMWDFLVDATIKALGDSGRPVVYLLFGKHAQNKLPYTPQGQYAVKAAHPSPYSANSGFFGSKPFSKANAFLASKDIASIDWTHE